MLDFNKIENEMLQFWEKKKIRKKALKMNPKGPKFYYLDGPPYTNGKIHLGHSWGKYIRDAVMRYKRMNGYYVWAQPGFDMHGLPIEVKVEKKLGINSKKEIEKIGVEKFIKMCKEFAIENMNKMIEDFKRLGVWLDWENPYMTASDDYISGVWYSIKKADEKGLLYKGKKVLTWCPRCETALAKHELEYKKRVDDSIYMKFPTKDGKFLIVWTTTPWTVPFNLAVMVNPELDYVEKKVGDEIWIIGKDRAELFEGEIIKEFKGKELEGIEYELPLEIPANKKIKAEWKHKVVLSEFVEEGTGTGLVHCAPGCGPEDNEIGKRYGLPAFNTVNEQGIIKGDMGKFTNLKTNDKKIIELLDHIIVKKEKIEHEYPVCWRCKTPVIFRATEQWFIEVTKLKEKLIEDAQKVKWIPNWSGNWFKSWLENIQDWTISRQRYWGVPIPIWVCENGHKVVVGSINELKKLSKKRKIEVHKPKIDEITFKCPKCGKPMKRISDVLDVWIDSGNAAWASLGYPDDEKLLKKLWPVDFIIEGKDQIRGWFYSTAALGEIVFEEIPYKAVYMTGMINDAKGRKMSKSLGNYITPFEVIDKYGSDVLRFYQIGGANPGLDLNYNENDVTARAKALNILWNIHNYLKENAEIEKVKLGGLSNLKIEDEWIVSRINSVIEEVTTAFENYEVHLVPRIIEEFFLEDLSRWYLKLIKDRIILGSKEEKKAAINTALYVFERLLRISAPVLPFLTEKMYQEMKGILNHKEESVHFLDWPKAERINKEIEEKMNRTREIVEKILAVRNRVKLGVRWPIGEVIVIGDPAFDEIIKAVANVKKVSYSEELPKFVEYQIKANYNSLKQKFDEKEIPVIIRRIIELSPLAVKKKFEKGESYELLVNDRKIPISEEDVEIVTKAPEGWEIEENVLVNTNITSELFKEGLAREIIRRIQEIRKERKMKRTEKATVYIDLPTDLSEFKDLIEEKTNSEVEFTKMIPTESKEFKIREITVKIGLE